MEPSHFSSFYKEHYNYLYCFALHKLQAMGIVQYTPGEIVQDVFEKLFKLRKKTGRSPWAEFQGPDKARKSWICRTIINHLKDIKKSARYRREVQLELTPESFDLEGPDCSAPCLTPPSLVIPERAALATLHFKEVIERLKGVNRGVFTLLLLGKSLADIAKILKIPFSTAQRIFTELKKEFSGRLDD